MLLKPWYDIVKPRNELYSATLPEAMQFTVNLEHVREEQALEEYSNPASFFTHTYLTTSLTHLASEVIWRLAGEMVEANAVFHVIGHSGEGKTHALTLLHHLTQHGAEAHKWMGIQKILAVAGASSIPQVHTAAFVGTEFDVQKGRRGKRTEPLRKTPWGEIAFQLGGKEAYAEIAACDEQMVAPEKDVLRDILMQASPCLILIDDLMEYAFRAQIYGMVEQCYHFLQHLTEQARTLEHVVIVLTFPAKDQTAEMERSSVIEQYQSLLSQVSKATPLATEKELPEIIRRRLFQWDAAVISPEGNVILSNEALETCATYSHWIRTNRGQLPAWIPFDQAEQLFSDAYPFHPAVFSVFMRKWQVLPQFQYTRGMLRLLAFWIASAHQDGYSKVYSDPLISLGAAPLEDLNFRTAVREQLGNDQRLKPPIFTDIVGREAFAPRLDNEAAADIKHDRLHQKTATVIFFESTGGMLETTRVEATAPEIRFAVGEPAMQIEHVDTVLEALVAHCYYLTRENKRYRFRLIPNLNKLFADRRQHIDEEQIEECVRAEIKDLFTNSTLVTLFPEEPQDVPDQPVLNLVVLSPEHTRRDPTTLPFLQALTDRYGDAPRVFRNAVIWVASDEKSCMYAEARVLLTWQELQNEMQAETASLQDTLDFDPANIAEQIRVNIEKARTRLRECVWQSYKQIALLNKEHRIEFLDLGKFQPGETNSLPLILLNQLRLFDYVVDTVSPRFLTRNWPGELHGQEWSTRAVREMFFTSPLFPRLLNPDILKETIAKGASNGLLGYVSQKVEQKYSVFFYQKTLLASEVEISDDMFIITPETAEAYLSGLTPTLTSLTIDPPQVNLMTGEKITFTAHALDEDGEEIKRNVHWEATGGTIDEKGVFMAGEKDGSDFEVRATAGEKSAWVKVTILSKKLEPPAQLVQQLAPPEERPEPPLLTHLTWAGKLSAETWQEFYHAILAPLSQEYGIDLSIRLGLSKQDGITEQQIEYLKNTLQQLNLPDDLQEH
ncbi:ATPase (AAA+ superfamily)-like protein [Candidatus Vecturithrix granuli]|uniref:ATPase (AAA+ superfamily)-like protein n=1 Tax=Vecturithrix granuli TaxID=1499967 RepID=A0A081BUD0_VECG1|nr:ATPase (AAA+ superfamily)-like protein [Candidatus Vecturithrix granuli]